MVEYNIVKFCRFCKARFVVPKGQSFQYLCKACEPKNTKTFTSFKKPVKKSVTKKKSAKK